MLTGKSQVTVIHHQHNSHGKKMKGAEHRGTSELQPFSSVAEMAGIARNG
jgi:hypothetical protein